MIQANELRIGVLVNTPFGIGSVDSIITHHANDGAVTTVKAAGISYQEGLLLEQIYPIPITPEILEKSGFKTSRKGVEWTIVVNQELGSVLIVQCVNGVYSLSCCPVEFQSVHQLQNLHHALTGTELKIQL